MTSEPAMGRCDGAVLREACQEYASEFLGDVDTPVASVDQILARLDEFTAFVESSLRPGLSVAEPELLGQVLARRESLEATFSAVDSLLDIVAQINQSLSVLEDRASQAEKFFSSVSVRNFVNSVSFLRKAGAAAGVLTGELSMPEWKSFKVPQITDAVRALPLPR